MLHQTLLSFPHFSPSSFPSPSASSSSSPQVAMKLSGLEQGFLAEDEMEDGGNFLCEDFQVEDLLDLRALSEFEEDEETQRVTENNPLEIYSEITVHDMDSASHECLSHPKSFPCAEIKPLELFSEITAQDTDAESLEWLSSFFDEISNEYPSPPPPPRFQTQNPQTRVKAKRSKRLRRSSFIKLTEYSPESSITSVTATSPTRSSASSCSLNSYMEQLCNKLKKRGRKPKSAFLLQGERRCTHCGVQKTPQWRSGPQGAKSLCNACGVRFKSGRLLPEYRPACSPTFVGSIHSNSHRKVLEMRRKNDGRVIPNSC